VGQQFKTKGARSGFCPYCRRKMSDEGDWDRRPSVDHVVPRSKGGKEKVWCCTKCNGMKGDMLPDEWRIFRSRNQDWFSWHSWRIAEWRKAYAVETAPIECNSPWQRVPQCGCDLGSGEPPTKLKRMECQLRGGPCAENPLAGNDPT